MGDGGVEVVECFFLDLGGDLGTDFFEAHGFVDDYYLVGFVGGGYDGFDVEWLQCVGIDDFVLDVFGG